MTTNQLMSAESSPDLRVAIVAEHASAKFGGEAALPLHYFRVLRERGISTWLVVHERTRSELTALFPNDPRIVYVADTPTHIALWRIGARLPARVAYFTVGYLQRALVQRVQKRIIRKLIADERVNIVHQPMPVSPREPSIMYGFGVPVVIGPMNGNIDYPPALRARQQLLATHILKFGRWLSDAMNHLFPGKLQSAVLLVANERTRQAIPQRSRARVIELVENGVDLRLWQRSKALCGDERASPTTFIYLGRLVDWKAVDLLLDAFFVASCATEMSLVVVGDGPKRSELMDQCRTAGKLARDRGDRGKVFFAGWQTQQVCASWLEDSTGLVLSSLMECGGAVVLEAMAAGRPVIATAWGGPADYLDSSCGILVKPTSRADMIADFARAMQLLASSPELRVSMGQAGRLRAMRDFDWEVKVDRILEIYAQAITDMKTSASQKS